MESDYELASAPVRRQTLSYLRQLLDHHGIRPKNKLGQNFLIDLNLLDVVVRSAELTRQDIVLEVGTGTGSLTARLAELAGLVLGVEIDPGFFNLTRGQVGGIPHVTLIHSDVLARKNELNADVLAQLATFWAAGQAKSPPMRALKLIANLPYAVATPVISNLLLTDLPIERMIVMVQWEIAERLVATPSTKDYGALSVFVQSIAETQILRKLPPEVFWPRPQVDSAIVAIFPKADRRAVVGDVTKLRHFLRDLYSHRRKNLRGALVGWPSGPKPKPWVDQKLAELGIPGTVRAETLDLAQHLRLCQAFQQASDEA